MVMVIRYKRVVTRVEDFIVETELSTCSPRIKPPDSLCEIMKIGSLTKIAFTSGVSRAENDLLGIYFCF